MTESRQASLALLFSSTLWGMSWWPLQQLAVAGVRGPALAMLTYGAVGVAALPLVWRERAALRPHAGALLLMALIGGWAAASFIIMLSLGDVVREMLFFYLAPAWSVLGARVVLGERIDRRRALAIAMAMAGAFLVILAGGPLGTQGMSAADWIALTSGMAFAGNNLAARAAPDLPIVCKVDATMLGCAVICAVVLLAGGLGLPHLTGGSALGLLVFTVVWTFLGTWTTTYGVTHLEAGKAVLLLLSELVASVVSVSLINGRVPSALEGAGGMLILCAAAMDALDRAST